MKDIFMMILECPHIFNGLGSLAEISINRNILKLSVKESSSEKRRERNYIGKRIRHAIPGSKNCNLNFYFFYIYLYKFIMRLE